MERSKKYFVTKKKRQMKKSSISLKRKNANIISKSSCKFFKKNLGHKTPPFFFL